MVAAGEEGRLPTAEAESLRHGASLEGRSFLVGLIGRGIQMSRTPVMHEREGRRRGLSYVYKLLDTDRMGSNVPSLGELVQFAESFGFSGFNVTYPYKQEILDHLTELSDDARAVGSVNTVVLRQGRRIGHNTDLSGFREGFRQSLGDAKRDTVLLLGAGGAGAAVGHALLECEVGKLLVHDIDAARAQALVARLAQRFGDDRVGTVQALAEAAFAADGLVNATPVGMAGRPGTPLAPDLIRPSMWVADIVYFPLETELLKVARRKGCRTMDGAGMAIQQAMGAFEHFTGIAPDGATMRAAFQEWEVRPEV